MTDHLAEIVARSKRLADAFERLGVVPDDVLLLREDEAEMGFYKTWNDPNATKVQKKVAYLVWQSAVFDRVLP